MVHLQHYDNIFKYLRIFAFCFVVATSNRTFHIVLLAQAPHTATVSLTVTFDYFIFRNSLGAGGKSVTNSINFSLLFFHPH